jgi:predicted nucleic acid-binding protein
MTVLVDTSAWIDYFRGGTDSSRLDVLIEEDLIATNDLILAELVPFLKVRNQRRLMELLSSVRRLTLEIDWREIIEVQTRCLRQGLNGIGIPDLIIAQNAKQHGCEVFSLDGHFVLLRKLLGLRVS